MRVLALLTTTHAPLTGYFQRNEHPSEANAAILGATAPEVLTSQVDRTSFFYPTSYARDSFGFMGFRPIDSFLNSHMSPYDGDETPSRTKAETSGEVPKWNYSRIAKIGNDKLASTVRLLTTRLHVR